ncbi:DUF4142 domain-containing protein [Deinococcus hopiensis]|uniref:DUF4142 domain-containing protein n=1 Tax=Deinococcus hopiensis TaxID=309885 RepID=UPI0014835CEB|nr:DUF4142 domain-containing protein [Deinococcus hopiensis]
MSDMFEIQSSQLAATQANSSGVKSLAAQLIRDHTAASRRLMTLAPRLAMQLPTSLQGPKVGQLTALRSQKGVAFDRAYAAAQVSAHEQAVNLFRAYIRVGSNAALKTHAQQTLPGLEKHLQSARALLKTVSTAKP